MTRLLALLFAAAALQDEPVKFEAPREWTKETPSSPMRKAQYKVPDKEKKAADAQLTLFYFGAGGGGGVEANLKRWAGQMGGAEAKPEKIEGKLKVTLVDLKGTYTEKPGATPIEDARMLGAIVETDKGPWFFKLVGPADTVGDWRDEMVKLLKEAQ